MTEDSIDTRSSEQYLLTAFDAAYRAAQGILEIYNSGTGFSVESKADDSPLTAADKKSHEIICSVLARDPGRDFPSSVKNGPSSSSIPILSEEGKNIPYKTRKQWKRFWLIDPLDGTKEFIKRNGEFTVNIALIDGCRPVLGVVCIPAKGEFYFGAENIGAFKLVLKEEAGADGGMSANLEVTEGHESKGMTARDFCNAVREKSLAVILHASSELAQKKQRDEDITEYTVIASRSHMNDETEEYIASLKEKYGHVSLVSAGSSLKICLVAEGKAHCYPRLGSTMEWDTAAAHAVARCAGKDVIIFDSNSELIYNKEDLLNPWFVVR